MITKGKKVNFDEKIDCYNPASVFSGFLYGRADSGSYRGSDRYCCSIRNQRPYCYRNANAQRHTAANGYGN